MSKPWISYKDNELDITTAGCVLLCSLPFITIAWMVAFGHLLEWAFR